METQNLPPSLIIFVFFSLVLSIWAIVDIFRSAFTKLSKILWLIVVVFAPFGVFIYLFLGRRLKPLPQNPAPDDVPPDTPRRKGVLPSPARQPVRWPAPLTLMALGVFCVLLYLKMVTYLGQEKTALFLIGAMVVIAAILVFFYINQARKK
ncbi:MAG TPA: PLD nuclease N-terminal domain-containing protein [Syntrophorhabdaceae bacterium]|jgi:hypothetical protein